MVEKYYNNKGEVAVLYCSEYGVGWSSRNSLDYAQFMLFDKGLVKLALANKQVDEVARYLEDVFLDSYNICISDWKNIKIAWLPTNTRFQIRQYSGREEIECLEDIYFFVT